MSEILLRKLQNYLGFSEIERKAVLSLPSQTITLPARQGLEEDTGGDGDVYVIEDGFACRYRMLSDGRRQILCYLVPGDVIDLRRFITGAPPPPAVSMSQLRMRAIPSSAVLGMIERMPRLMRALWWSTIVDESIVQEWLVSLGQRTALERISHLFCELLVRLKAVGMAEQDSFRLPVTQAELADTLGLSTVHVNRTLQELRRMDQITLQNGIVTVTSFEKLQALALFSPAYLQMRAATPPPLRPASA
ncbi:Crp/Fnr family transcriptional regulator [Pelagibacterium montanilacus]|uniref:Crp/Fnr family transcriptional regulator n=1 Tax=Pelagibacterium montanilacus TaxID=2185280 RepID=UPI000F8C3215|nr:Crp/Fnr family transcriptional regulator [Pelagibacterium montanilacus]